MNVIVENIRAKYKESYLFIMSKLLRSLKIWLSFIDTHKKVESKNATDHDQKIISKTQKEFR